MIHVPASIVLLAMLFWHCHNYLTSWHYLFSTVGIWLVSYMIRLFYLNWTNPWRMSWLIGEEAAVTLLPENAIKVTIPTQVKWKPGQYVYLRMPGVSVFENHPFTIASLCSDDFPSAYGEQYRDMVVVFRPFGGFTKKVLETALEHGPWRTYRAFLDGPYGGMRRSMDSFDHVVMFAGGSGITAVVSQLLDLIKRMRDGKAVTKTVQLVWAMKRPETMEWFKEELRICREFAPPNAVQCQFYITAAKRQAGTGTVVSAQTPSRPVSMVFHDKVNDMFQNIASNRFSMNSSRPHSELIHDEAKGDPEREKELRYEGMDRLRPLPEAHYKTVRAPSPTPPAAGLGIKEMPHMPPHPTLHEKRRSRSLSIDINNVRQSQATQMEQLSAMQNPQQFDFGFPSTPTEFQKNLMRFAFMPAAVKARKSGWSTEWGRPDIPYMLRDMCSDWTGRRTCVFVCGPPSMRVDVSNTVADLQKMVLRGEQDEIYLHTENYAL
jgi:NAD(P)H-flavin reductase